MEHILVISTVILFRLLVLLDRLLLGCALLVKHESIVLLLHGLHLLVGG